MHHILAQPLGPTVRGEGGAHDVVPLAHQQGSLGGLVQAQLLQHFGDQASQDLGPAIAGASGHGPSIAPGCPA